MIAHSTLDDGAPLPGALVIFEDRNGDTRTATTDDDGRASGEIEPGGTVWLVDGYDPQFRNAPSITAYTEVQGGSTVEFGPPPVPASAPVKAMMTVSGSPPQGADGLMWQTNCSPRSTTPGVIVFDERCGTTAEVLLMATDLVGGTTGTVLVSYIYLPAQPITDGGTITIDPNAWMPPQEVVVTFVHGTVSSYGVTSPWGAYQRDNRVPIAGTTMHVHGTIRDSSFLAAFPAATSATIDLDNVLGPTIEQERASNGDVTWRVIDTGGGIRVANAVAYTYLWTQPVENYELSMFMMVYGPADTEGVIEHPQLPPQLAKVQPGEGFLVTRHGYLLRIEGVDPADAPRVAELTMMRSGGPLVPYDPDLATNPGLSVAATFLFE